MGTVIGDSLIGNQIVEGVAIILLSSVVFILSLFGAVIYKRFQIKHYAKLEVNIK